MSVVIKLAFVYLGKYFSRLSEGQLSWMEYSYLACYFFQLCVIPLSLGV